MGYIATDLARVPKGDYDWYIFLLEDGWNDDLRSELSDNFRTLARQVGPSALVVQGADPLPFYDQVFYEYALQELQTETDYHALPALLITDTPPSEIREDRTRVESAKMLLMPLSKRYVRAGSITDILKELVSAIKKPEAFEALQTLDEQGMKTHWCRLLSYFELKPSFFGFGLNVNKIIEEICSG